MGDPLYIHSYTTFFHISWDGVKVNGLGNVKALAFGRVIRQIKNRHIKQNPAYSPSEHDRYEHAEDIAPRIFTDKVACSKSTK